LLKKKLTKKNQSVKQREISWPISNLIEKSLIHIYFFLLLSPFNFSNFFLKIHFLQRESRESHLKKMEINSLQIATFQLRNSWFFESTSYIRQRKFNDSRLFYKHVRFC